MDDGVMRAPTMREHAQQWWLHLLQVICQQKQLGYQTARSLAVNRIWKCVCIRRGAQRIRNASPSSHVLIVIIRLTPPVVF